MSERQSFVKLFAVLSTLGCWSAGGYLLLTEPADPNTLFAAIMDGMGLYFIAKGFFVGPSLWKQAQQVELLRGLGSYAAHEAERKRES